MRVKWFLFEHAIDSALRDGKPQRGPIAAHLCESPGEPICNARDAVLMPDATAQGGGFMLACISCLAYSEVTQ